MKKENISRKKQANNIYLQICINTFIYIFIYLVYLHFFIYLYMHCHNKSILHTSSVSKEGFGKTHIFFFSIHWHGEEFTPLSQKKS